jgi:serine/threonine-protein kinase
MIGKSIGHYRILEEIGRGGMGVVYLALDEDMPRKVALKLLPPGTLDDVVKRQRLWREAAAQSRLNHPAVAVVHEYISQPDYDCIVMEYVKGESLDAIVRRGPLDERQVLRLGLQLAQGLAALHETGFIHRDLKPQNLRVTPDGWLKILDFGLAKRSLPNSEGVSQALTESQDLAGTAPYLAPEVWGGAPASERSDLYAAGVILYEMATGLHPFHDFASRGFAWATLNVEPAPPRTRNPAISPDFESVILHCMQKDPVRRMPSAQQLASVLESLYMPRPARPRPVWARGWAVGIGTALIVASLYPIGVWLHVWPARDGAMPIRSLAVLPVANFTHDPGQQDVADDMTDGLISKLGEYASLRVIDRTTMMTYKVPATAPTKTLRVIARELRVEGVVQGSVKRIEDHLEYSFQLIRVRDGHQLLSKRYRGDVGDGPAIQGRAAGAIAARIGIAGAGGDPVAHAVDPAAYNLYLQGRFNWNRRSEEGVRQAIACFTSAIAKDSLYAPAYSGLADAWSTAGHMGLTVPLDAYPRAKQAALQALAIDSTLSDAYVSLGNIRQNFDWDWAGAERDFRRAIELNPSNSEAHHWYANLLTYRGEFKRATVEIENARAVDPLSLPINIGGAALLYFERRHDEAFSAFQAVARIDSSSGLLYRAMAGNLYQMGREAETARAIQRWLENEYPAELARAAAGAYQRAGLPGMARVLLGALAGARQAGHYKPATHLAELSIVMGDREGAFRWLALALAEHDSELNRLGVDPVFDPLRGDARFQGLLRSIGLGTPA